MTDNEIIKALDDRMYCGKWIGKGFLDKKDFQILKNALDLINRQKAEIDRLTKETMNMAINIETCQTEAIKKFAKKLKERQVRICDCFEGVSIIDIDKLAKETEG